METYSHLKPYSRPSDYIGQTWEGWYAVAGRSRDSDSIEEANYQSTMEHLRAIHSAGAESQYEIESGESALQDTRCNHWAVGWVETIYIHESRSDILKAADELLSRLAEYPVLDEDLLSRLEWESASEAWEHMSLTERIDTIAKQGEGVSIFAARRDEIPRDDNGGIFDWLRTP